MQVRVTTVLLLLAALPAILSLPWEEWRGTEMLKQSLPVEISEEIKQADTQSIGTFSGCYSDTNARILDKVGPTTESDMNINADCEMTCQEKGYTIASTRGRKCYCTNSLPLPQLYRANDSHASGNSGPCSMTCPGAWTEENCQQDECCGGENTYSVFIVGGSQQMLQRDAAQLQEETKIETLKHFQVADIQTVGTFDGCYSDKEANVLGGASGLTYNFNDNYNAKCQLVCREKGYAIASTKGSNCYCTYTLPLPQLYRADSRLSAGNGGPCSTVCPGVFTTSSCRGDECCGGTNAASVYIVGSIDALKQLERRVIDRVLQSPMARKLVRGNQELNFHVKRQWKANFRGTVCTYTQGNLLKSGQISTILYKGMSSGNQGTTVTDVPYIKLSRPCTLKHLRVTANYNEHVTDTTRDKFYLYVTSETRPTSRWGKSYPSNVAGGKVVIDAFLPKDLKPIRRMDLWVYNFYSPCRQLPTEIFLEAWGHCPFIEPEPQFGVSVTAMGLTATKNGVGGVKVYNLTRLNEKEILAEIPLSKSPLKKNQKTDLKLTAMEKLLESDLSAEEKPFTGWDIMCDNIFGSADFKCKKDYTETTSFEESWSTQHGFDLSVTVGAEFETGVFFAKATTTFEVTAGYSFSAGHTKTKSKEISATFGIEGNVPKGARMEVRFSKADIPVQVKWRASIFADGYVLVKLHDPVTGDSLIEEPAKLHLSQILSYNERILFAFGTINYGKRTTLIARTKVVDRSGRVLSERDQEKPVLQDISN